MFTEMPVDQQVFMREPVQHLMNTTVCDVPLPIQKTSNMPHFPPAGAGQISPAEGTLALGQYSPLESAFMGTQQHMPQADPEPDLHVQATSNDSGMTSAFVLQPYSDFESVTVRSEVTSCDSIFVAVCVYFQAVTSLGPILG